MKYKLIILIFILIPVNLFSQFTVSVTQDKNQACQNSDIVFNATAKDGTIDVSNNTEFFWDFGDNSVTSGVGIEKQQVTHQYTEGGGYYVKLTAKYSNNEDYQIIKVQISLAPDFRGTSTDVEKDIGICLGETITLTGKVAQSEWIYELPTTIEESIPFEVSDNNNFYKSIITHKAFDKNDVFSASTDFEKIGLKMEHSNLGNIQIKITCPTGKIAILKDYSTTDSYLGEPIDNEASSDVGTPYYYYWTLDATSNLNNNTNSYSSMPSGNYKSDEVLSNLDACPFNGDWTIEITDNTANDNGFVFDWYLGFKGTKLPTKWKYSNTYSLNKSIWDGDGIGGTSNGIATAIPISIANKEYKFMVTDDYSCSLDTSLYVKVEAVTLTANPETGDAPLELNLKTSVSWAVDYIWDLGDGSTNTNSEFTHTYSKNGNYKINLTATSKSACQGTDTITIYVTIPPSSFESSNVFTPNGDGINDVFKLKLESMETVNCIIYSRWGRKVCQWSSAKEADNGWDGTIRNSDAKASPGVYFYVLKAVGYDGKTYNETGNIHLFRQKK